MLLKACTDWAPGSPAAVAEGGAVESAWAWAEAEGGGAEHGTPDTDSNPGQTLRAGGGAWRNVQDQLSATGSEVRTALSAIIQQWGLILVAFILYIMLPHSDSLCSFPSKDMREFLLHTLFYLNTNKEHQGNKVQFFKNGKRLQHLHAIFQNSRG